MIINMILGLCFLGILGCVFFLIRNEWVYKQRIGFLDRRDLEGFDGLQSYDSMYYKFWIWDIDKFKNK